MTITNLKKAAVWQQDMIVGEMITKGNKFKRLQKKFSKQSKEDVNNFKKSEPPIAEQLIELLKASAIVGL